MIRRRPFAVARAAAVLVLFAVATVIVTWPVPRRVRTDLLDPLGLSRVFPDSVHPDSYLTAWLVGRGVRWGDGRPAWDAGIFHPAPRSLAYSEHMMGVLPVTLPLHWAGANPILVHQGLFLATFALSGAAAAWLVAEWTGSLLGAVVAGAAFGFAPWRFTSFLQIHLLAIFYLPVVLLLASRHLGRGGCFVLVGFSIALFLQAMCAYALAYPAFGAVVMFILAHAVLERPPFRRVVSLLAATVATIVAAAVTAMPYRAILKAGVRAVLAGAAPELMLRQGGTGAWGWLHPAAPYHTAAAVLVLGVVGMASAFARREESTSGTLPPRVIVATMLCMAAPLMVLAAGPARVPALRVVWDQVPGMSLYRVPARFGIPVSLASAVLAGCGMAAIERRLGHRRLLAMAAGATAVGLILWEVWIPSPRTVSIEADADTSAYGWLALQPGREDAVLEIPAGVVVGAPFSDSAYVYRSLTHGHRLVNGYSGYGPASYFLLLELARQLPALDPLKAIHRMTGLRWIVVHGAALAPAERDAWRTPPSELAQVWSSGDDAIFEVRLRARADWRSRYVMPPVGVTFDGTPLRPIGAAAGDIALTVPRAARAGATIPIGLRVTNAGRRAWPALTVDEALRVTVVVSWTPESGQHGETAARVVLPRDVRPGEAAATTAYLQAPRVPGAYRVSAALVQGSGLPVPLGDPTASTVTDG